MPRQLQFGLGVPPGATFPVIPCNLSRSDFPAELHRLLASLPDAFESAWMIDHLQFDSGDVLEGWTTMTYLMGAHPRQHFGNMVLSQSFRNPALLGKMAASLQYLSGHRLYLGIGTGWKEDEYHAYGYPFPSPGTRVEELEEALHVIGTLWTETPATFTGQHYRINNAWCEPKPEYPPPIMIGGKKPRMLRLIARHADWWNIDWASADECRPLVEQMETACVEVGRDPATLRRTWFGWVACAATTEEARAIAEDGQAIDTYFSKRRNAQAAQRFFERAIDETGVTPLRVTTDKAKGYPPAPRTVLPDAEHRTSKYLNNGLERDHGHLKQRLYPMHGFKQASSADIVARGHALIRNLRNGFSALTLHVLVDLALPPLGHSWH